MKRGTTEQGSLANWRFEEITGWLSGFFEGVEVRKKDDSRYLPHVQIRELPSARNAKKEK